jgi:nucleotidyltransferase/DNA polymerase involved in DNA repair
MEQRLHRAGILTVAQLWKATPHQLRRVWAAINGVLFHQMLHGVHIQPPSSRYSKKHRPSACAGAGVARQKGRA